MNKRELNKLKKRAHEIKNELRENATVIKPNLLRVHLDATNEAAGFGGYRWGLATIIESKTIWRILIIAVLVGAVLNII
tara:strand:- start:47 stop:283 length:237 start_codon:yes stop_codon:yes gene_type:complete